MPSPPGSENSGNPKCTMTLLSEEQGRVERSLGGERPLRIPNLRNSLEILKKGAREIDLEEKTLEGEQKTIKLAWNTEESFCGETAVYLSGLGRY